MEAMYEFENKVMSPIQMAAAFTLNDRSKRLLERILFWQPKATISKAQRSWVAKSRAEWAVETTLSELQVKKALCDLRASGVIVTRQGLFGGKNITHVSLTDSALHVVFAMFDVVRQLGNWRKYVTVGLQTLRNRVVQALQSPLNAHSILGHQPTPQEQPNALNELKEVTLHGSIVGSKKKALEKAQQSLMSDPYVQALKAAAPKYFQEYNKPHTPPVSVDMHVASGQVEHSIVGIDFAAMGEAYNQSVIEAITSKGYTAMVDSEGKITYEALEPVPEFTALGATQVDPYGATQVEPQSATQVVPEGATHNIGQTKEITGDVTPGANASGTIEQAEPVEIFPGDVVGYTTKEVHVDELISKAKLSDMGLKAGQMNKAPESKLKKKVNPSDVDYIEMAFRDGYETFTDVGHGPLKKKERAQLKRIANNILGSGYSVNDAAIIVEYCAANWDKFIAYVNVQLGKKWPVGQPNTQHMLYHVEPMKLFYTKKMALKEQAKEPVQSIAHDLLPKHEEKPNLEAKQKDAEFAKQEEDEWQANHDALMAKYKKKK